MVIRDLKQTCSRCQGSGRQTAVQEWGIAQINPGGRCHGCGGRGFVLTELGRDVLEMLRPFIEDIVEERLRAARPEPPRREPDDEPA